MLTTHRCDVENPPSAPTFGHQLPCARLATHLAHRPNEEPHVTSTTVHERDVDLPDGRTLHVYDTDPSGDAERVVVYHHGSPNIGSPPAPLFATSEEVGVRWLGYDRPAYGGSTARPGRTVGSAGAVVAAIADAVGISTFAVMGHSGGGPHALACAALLPGRVSAALSISGLAPYDAEGLDFFDGMAAAGVGSLRAAAAGRDARAAYEEAASEDDIGFIEADEQALSGEWSWFLDVVRPAIAQGPDGMIDDDVAATSPWEFDVRRIDVPVLVVHGQRDRMVPPGHGAWLADAIPGAELRTFADEGHVSVMHEAPNALRWLAGHL
jgi:pimeloyl-ACP methyl ester carboxylesterase